MRYQMFALCTLLGCATASREHVAPDARQNPQPDASHVGPTDAPSSTDGAAHCTTMTSDLLMNGSFDGTPAGMGWTSTPANPSYPIVTTNGLAAQSTPLKAWMGSFVSASDDMHEDVAVPASTTALVVAGFYQVHTTETGTTPVDTAKVDLADTSGTSLESALALDNTQATTSWMPFSYPVTSNVAGQTIRLRFVTTNNSTKPTSFYFDTVSLKATFCQ